MIIMQMINNGVNIDNIIISLLFFDNFGEVVGVK